MLFSLCKGKGHTFITYPEKTRLTKETYCLLHLDGVDPDIPLLIFEFEVEKEFVIGIDVLSWRLLNKHTFLAKCK